MTRHIFKDEKSRKQIAIYRLNRSMDIDDMNARGLAEWKRKNANGAWDRHNYEENFGEEECTESQ